MDLKHPVHRFEVHKQLLSQWQRSRAAVAIASDSICFSPRNQYLAVIIYKE